MVEHCASNGKIMGSIPRESKSWSNVKTVTWMQCKSLWIKVSAKCINVNMKNWKCIKKNCMYCFIYFLSQNWNVSNKACFPGNTVLLLTTKAISLMTLFSRKWCHCWWEIDSITTGGSKTRRPFLLTASNYITTNYNLLQCVLCFK